MKANTPEKIYLRHNHKGDIGASWLVFPLTDNDIEYIRKDAFIEKVCDYLNKTCRRFILTEKDIDDLKKYMKGE
jgi:hypothetical protein